MVVSNRLLSGVNIILFLNKVRAHGVTRAVVLAQIAPFATIKCDLLKVSSFLRVSHVFSLKTAHRRRSKMGYGSKTICTVIVTNRMIIYLSQAVCQIQSLMITAPLTIHIDFRNKFGAIHQSYTPDKSRELYSEFASYQRRVRT